MADVLKEGAVNHEAMDCGNGSCGGCCGGMCTGSCAIMELTQSEINVLSRFSQVPFLPIALNDDISMPVYLEDGQEFSTACGEAILGLARKRLIQLDYDRPLTNFDYAGYERYPRKGSMALTARGQSVLDLIDYQGIEAKNSC